MLIGKTLLYRLTEWTKHIQWFLRHFLGQKAPDIERKLLEMFEKSLKALVCHELRKRNVIPVFLSAGTVTTNFGKDLVGPILTY